MSVFLCVYLDMNGGWCGYGSEGKKRGGGTKQKKRKKCIKKKKSHVYKCVETVNMIFKGQKQI